MKCPVCESHTTSFANLLQNERQFYMMPFVRTCPHCRAKIRIKIFPVIGLVGLVVFLHSAIEVGPFIARRYGFNQDNAVIGTILIFAVPFFVLLFFLWKHTSYSLR